MTTATGEFESTGGFVPAMLSGAPTMAQHDLEAALVGCCLDDDEPPPLLPASPPEYAGDGGLFEDPSAEQLAALFREATEATWGAVRAAEVSREQELRATGERLNAEQERLYQIVMLGLPGAVRAAASRGQRVATVLRFCGADKLDEFCYLYMLKGPHNPEHRAEMKALGARPLLYRLRAKLQGAGFGVHHAWQRATNENTLSVTW